MTHLLDTNAVIDLFTLPTGTPTNVPDDAVTHVSVITHLEMDFGVASAAHRQDPARLLRMTGSLQRLLTTWVPVPVDDVVAGAFLEVARAALAAGQNPRRRTNDLVIAATARARGWTLVTGDRTLLRAVDTVVPVVALR
ncbi:PIN domain-containing protein [Kineococcus sp. LSe6-4]|uniref:Ribonuclease VapC n=1 Tax=Kineococcus halophytocola TaxID=3234027 RepID=A0ABV4H1E2_9ACTN